MRDTKCDRTLGACWYRFWSQWLLPCGECLPNSGIRTSHATRIGAMTDVLLFIQSDHKYARALIVLVAVLHAALALVFKVEFFAYYVVKNIGPEDPTGEAPALRF